MAVQVEINANKRTVGDQLSQRTTFSFPSHLFIVAGQHQGSEPMSE